MRQGLLASVTLGRDGCTEAPADRRCGGPVPAFDGAHADGQVRPGNVPDPHDVP
jgi:hypothetical protein